MLKERDSEDYNRFICVYHYYRDCLQEREKTILDLQYGIKGNIPSLKEIGVGLGIAGNRVSQIRNKGERRITKEILVFLYGKSKEAFSCIIAEQPDEILVRIGQAIRSWDPIILNHFDNEQPRYYKRRKKLEHALFRAWMIGALDHREQARRILNIDKKDVY